MSRANTWTNSDGVNVGFGTHSSDNNVPAVTGEEGALKTMVMQIVGANLGTSYAATDVPRQAAFLRRGSLIKSATLQADTAWTGTGTLTIGTWGIINGGSTITTEVVDDADGIDATIDVDVALATAGISVECDGALVGGVSVSVLSVGEVSNSDCVIGAFYSTSAVTGTATLTVQYIEPRFTDPLVV